MADASEIREHMDVLGSDGQHVGTVDKIEGSRIKLTRTDPAAQGEHHYLHLDMVASVEGGAVRLGRTAAQAKDEWGVASIGQTDVPPSAEPGSSTGGP